MSDEATDNTATTTTQDESTQVGQTDNRSLFERYLAPNYPYHKNISTPDDLNMKIDGGLDTLANDFVGLINYAELLMAGSGNANRKIKFEGKNQPLGDRIFIDTPGTCYPVNLEGKLINPDNNEVLADQEKKDQFTATRSVFIDHIPTGYIPGLGNMGSMRGLIPGMLGNLLELNPVSLLSAFTAEAKPPCLRTKMKEIKYKEGNSLSSKHEESYSEYWVAEEDLRSLNACSFRDAYIDNQLFNNQNPITKQNGDCQSESFKNLFSKTKRKSLLFNTKNKPLANVFNATFGLILAYLLFKVLKKEL